MNHHIHRVEIPLPPNLVRQQAVGANNMLPPPLRRQQALGHLDQENDDQVNNFRPLLGFQPDDEVPPNDNVPPRPPLIRR